MGFPLPSKKRGAEKKLPGVDFSHRGHTKDYKAGGAPFKFSNLFFKKNF